LLLTTDDKMEFEVHDDAESMRRLLELPVSSRLDALAAMRGVSTFDTSAMKMLREIHEHGDGFRVEIDDPRYRPALERLVKADAWGQLQRELTRAWDYQNASLPGIDHPEKIEVTLTLGNPDDPVFVERTLGYYGMGAQPGTIWLVAWPNDYNETRIGACAVHELAHNVRTPNVSEPFNLAEWIVHEGLAEVFTVEVCGPESTGGWYADVTGEKLDAAWEIVVGALGTGSTFRDWSPYVLGDEVARRVGTQPVGMPHMGGYAVGRKIVEKYLASVSLKAAQAMVRPASEILEGAGITPPK